MKLMSTTYLIPCVLLLSEVFTLALSSEDQTLRHSTHHHHRHHRHHNHPQQLQNDIPQSVSEEWTPWSTCSVDCGFGVHRRTRGACTGSGDDSGLCNRNTEELKVCEITGCIKPVEDICRDLNKRIYRGKRYRWIPYTHPNHACEMACRPMGAGFFLGLNQQYPDGTPCAEDSSKVCHDGICKAVGCDGVIESKARVDSCGVCGGDSSTCKLVRKIFTDSVKFGYHTIATIPRGSTGIVIRETEASRNYLAVKATDGSFSINSDFRLSRFGENTGAGTVFMYERSTGDDCPDECIHAEGPTNVSIDVMILSYTENRGIEYSFYVPSTYTDFDDVTVDGAGPTVYIEGGRIPGTDTKLSVDRSNTDSFKDRKGERRPIFSYDFKFKKNKNDHEHKQHGEHTEESNIVDDDDVIVSETSDSRDSQSSSIVEEVTGTDDAGETPDEIDEDSHSTNDKSALESASSAVISKTDNSSNTSSGDMYNNDNRIPSLYSWKLAGYTECSETCGQGKKYPVLECIVTDKNVKVDERYCGEEAKPLIPVRECNFGPCPARWKPGTWTDCSVTCGTGMQSRDYMCVQADGTVVNSYRCASSRPGRDQQPCDMGSCTSGWYFTEWPEYCPATCGYGTIFRGVHCVSEVDNESKVCPEREKPQSQKSCRNDDCRGIWLTGPWSECNATCGEAYQTRAVACAQKQGGRITIVTESACMHEEKPTTEMSCDMKICVSQWYMSDWSQCSVTCGSGQRSRNVKCLNTNKRSSSDCDPWDRPADREACTERRCPPSDQSIPSESSRSRPELESQTDRPRLTQTPPTTKEIPTQAPPTLKPIQTQPPQSVTQRPTQAPQTSRPRPSQAPQTETLQPVTPRPTRAPTTAIPRPTRRPTPRPRPDECEDSYTQCTMVLRAKLCQYSYYQRLCCYTCTLPPPTT